MTPTTFVSQLLCPECHKFTECDANSKSVICDTCGYDIVAQKRWKEPPQTRVRQGTAREKAKEAE